MHGSGKVSVLMGVFNCESYIADAVQSILNQTYSNLELIICDDGSTDHTLKIIRELEKIDQRIRVIENHNNKGLNYTLNHCLKYADGEFIARQDGDDISLPYRFEKQVSFLRNNPEYRIVSSPMIYFDDNGDWGRGKAIRYPQPEDVVRGTPICHAPVMMYKECLDRVHGYTVASRMIRVEDVNLWIKLYAEGYRCCNIMEPLYKMRNDKNALMRRKYKYRINSTLVRLEGCMILHLRLVNYIYAFKPMIYGLVPARIRQYIKQKQ